MLNIILVTGFLGSGKTTCMQNILNDYKDEKIGVIVNEFGEESIDGKLIEKTGLNMIELNNGSIFCQCIKANFVDALCNFADTNISYLFIEASGLADHSNIESLLKTVEKIKNKNLNYLCSICIVDACYFLKQLDLLPTLKRQVQYSNIIVINKIDIVNNDYIHQIEGVIKNLNKDAHIIKTSFCSFNIREAISQKYNISATCEDSTNSVETRPLSGKIIIKNCIEHNNLYNFVNEISSHCFRIKGFVKTTDGSFEVNCVNESINILEWSKPISENKIIFISKLGIKTISIITTCANKYNLDITLNI